MSYMLGVANEHIMLSVVMINVIMFNGMAPISNPVYKYFIHVSTQVNFLINRV